MATAERIYPMTPHQAVALSKFRLRPALRDQAEPIEDKAIDMRVHVYGTLSVAPDTEKSDAERIDPWRIVAVLWALLGGRRLDNVVKQAYSRDASDVEEVKSTAMAAYDKIAERKTVKRRGDVRGKLQFEKLGRD